MNGDFPVVDGNEPPWLEEDRKAWQQFLRTSHGQRLVAMVNYHEQATNRAMMLRTENLDNCAGVARGWHMASVHFFKTLSADVRPQQDEDTQDSTGAAGLRERHAP